MIHPDPPKPSATIRQAECRRCCGIRNCDIRGEHAVSYSDKNFDSQTVWYILQCRGCEYVFVQTVETNSEDYSPEYAQNGSEEVNVTRNETIKYWPALSRRTMPDWMNNYRSDTNNFYILLEALIEIYGALNNDLGMLAAIGIRAAFDIASGLLEIDSTLPFRRKLDGLVDGQHIGQQDRDRFNALVEAGNASVHRGWQAQPAELTILMDVLENFIHKTFVAKDEIEKLNKGAAELQKTVPPRQSRTEKPMVENSTKI